MPNPGDTAKFPAAIAAVVADFGGSFPSLAAPTTLVLQTSLVAGDLSVVATVPIPASYPSAGWIVIDSEVIKYTSFTGSTFTVTRAAQGTTAASHTAGASIGLWLTTQTVNQLVAEVVALETTWSAKGRPWFDVKAYGAVGDGVTDDTVALQAAATALNATNGGVFFLPTGKYLMTGAGTEQLLFTKPVIVMGVGVASKIVVGAAVGAAVDVIRVAPTTGGGDFSVGHGSFVQMRDFVIIANSGTPARHAINIDLTTAGATIYARRWMIERVWLGALGGRGIVLNNGTFASPTHTDGFFSSVIRGCQINNGIQLVANGDAISIEDNVFTGANAAIEVTQISGATGPWITKNNITSTGGALWAKSGYGIVFRGNEVEQSVAYAGGSGNAVVDIDGTSESCTGPLIEGNTILWIGATANPMDMVRINSATDAVVRHNIIRPPSGKQGVRITASSTGALVGRNSIDLTLGGGFVVDAGTETTVLNERGIKAVAYAATITPNGTNGQTLNVAALTGNVIVAAPSYSFLGARLEFLFQQDPTGGRTVTWNAVFIHSWSDTGNTVSRRSSITFVFDGGQWIQLGAQRVWA